MRWLALVPLLTGAAPAELEVADPPGPLEVREPLRFERGKKKSQLPLIGEAGHVAYAPDGKTRVLYWYAPTTWVTASGKRIEIPDEHNVTDVAFSSDSSRIALIGTTVEPIFTIHDVASGETLHRRDGYTMAAAFLDGNPDTLIYIPGEHTSGPTHVMRLDAPFTTPRPVTEREISFYSAWLSTDGRRAVFYSRYEPSPNSLFIVEVPGGDVRRLDVPEKVGWMQFAPDGSRICWYDESTRMTSCLRLDKRALETVSECRPLQFDGAGRKLLLRCYGEHDYALADFHAGTVAALAGVKEYSGGGAEISWGGTGIATGAGGLFFYFDLVKKTRHRVKAAGRRGLYAIKPIVGRPHAMAVGGENDTNFELYLFEP